MTAKCSELVMRCFEARTAAHVAHLTTVSYAAHKALDEFYTGIVDLADSFAEAAQGRYGLLKYSPVPSTKSVDPGHPEIIPIELRAWIDENRDSCTKHRELQNLIDEILHLCDSTIYKLKNLS